MSQNPKTLINNVKHYFDQNVHDTKNLLNYLILWLDMPDRGKKKDEVQAMLLEMQQTYMTKITELRDDFDHFLSVATDNTEPVELESLATWLDPYLDNYWRKRGNPGKLVRELDSNISLSYPTAYLSSIVSSLLDNAVQYRADERELLVRVILRQEESDTVVLQVQDNGIGFDVEQHRKALFQPFQRFSSRGDGKGLSLHLIKTTVEGNGGTIELESVVGEGTNVMVFLQNYE